MNLLDFDGVFAYLSSIGYTRMKVIGCGGSAAVLSARYNSERVALKCVSMAQLSPTFKREHKILSCLQHPNILELRECLVDDRNPFGILEMELLDHDLMSLIEVKPLEEIQCRMIFMQICMALSYCHERGIAHLDIKPENILLKDIEAKLCDFGAAMEFTAGKIVNDKLKSGTFFYAPPEVICGRPFYPDKVDVWSAGILLFTMLTGSWPYSSGSEEEIYLQVAAGKLILSKSKYKLSDEVISLFHSIFQLDPAQRPTFDEILQHPWLEGPTISRRSRRYSIYRLSGKFRMPSSSALPREHRENRDNTTRNLPRAYSIDFSKQLEELSEISDRDITLQDEYYGDTLSALASLPRVSKPESPKVKAKQTKNRKSFSTVREKFRKFKKKLQPQSSKNLANV